LDIESILWVIKLLSCFEGIKQDGEMEININYETTMNSDGHCRWYTQVARTLLVFCLFCIPPHPSHAGAIKDRSMAQLRIQLEACGKTPAERKASVLRIIALYDEGSSAPERVLGYIQSPNTTEALAWARPRVTSELLVTTESVFAKIILDRAKVPVQFDGYAPCVFDDELSTLGGTIRVLLDNDSLAVSLCSASPKIQQYLTGLRGRLAPSVIASLKSNLESAGKIGGVANRETGPYFGVLLRVYLNQEPDSAWLRFVWDSTDLRTKCVILEALSDASDPGSLIPLGLNLAAEIGNSEPASVPQELKDAGSLFLQKQAQDPAVRKYVHHLLSVSPGAYYYYLDRLAWGLLRQSGEGQTLPGQDRKMLNQLRRRAVRVTDIISHMPAFQEAETTSPVAARP
jgi:hypothetical protein